MIVLSKEGAILGATLFPDRIEMEPYPDRTEMGPLQILHEFRH